MPLTIDAVCVSGWPVKGTGTPLGAPRAPTETVPGGQTATETTGQCGVKHTSGLTQLQTGRQAHTNREDRHIDRHTDRRAESERAASQVATHTTQDRCVKCRFSRGIRARCEQLQGYDSI